MSAGMEETSSPSRRSIAPSFHLRFTASLISVAPDGCQILFHPQTDWEGRYAVSHSWWRSVIVLVEELGALWPDWPFISWPVLECTQQDDSLTVHCKHPSGRRRGAYGCIKLPVDCWACWWASVDGQRRSSRAKRQRASHLTLEVIIVGNEPSRLEMDSSRQEIRHQEWGIAEFKNTTHLYWLD